LKSEEDQNDHFHVPGSGKNLASQSYVMNFVLVFINTAKVEWWIC
jgi:hypothetical protein